MAAREEIVVGESLRDKIEFRENMLRGMIMKPCIVSIRRETFPPDAAWAGFTGAFS